MVVLKDMDIEAIEQTHVYKGQYFVLGGLVPMIEEHVERYVRIQPLIDLIRQRAESNHLEEIILALPYNPEGEHTRLYVAKKIEPLVEKLNLRITTLGRGLSTGTELEYIDTDTFENALSTRFE